MKPQLLFEHIPKTAGSTFCHVLQRQYDSGFGIQGMGVLESLQAFEQLPPQKQKAFDFVRGHGAMLLAPYLKKLFAITFLRHPVAHFLSQYHFILNNSAHRSHRAILKLNGVEDYFGYAKENGEDNLQTRVMAQDTSWITRNPTRQSDQNMLRIAMQNIQRFDRVFLTEHFDEALLMLQKHLHWKSSPFYVRINQNKNKQKQPPPNRDLIKRIETFQHLDMQIYTKAVEIFESYRTSWPTVGELSRFRAKNRWAGPLVHVAQLLKRAFRKLGRRQTKDG